MLSDLYSNDILRFAANIPRTERLAAPQATATEVSRTCGSKVSVDVNYDGEQVTDFGIEVKACALGQAACSILARQVIGKSLCELRAVGARMNTMLKEHGPAPDGDWADLVCLQPVADYSPRHTSVMLPFVAVMRAIEQILEEQAAVES
jgi:NifU-like protein involved in Fe-S cluster formation